MFYYMYSIITDVLRYLLTRDCGLYNFGQANVEILTFNKNEQATGVDSDSAVGKTYKVM